MRSISDVEKRIVELRIEMMPLQKLYGLKSKTIEERYQEFLVKEQLKKSIPQPKFRLPKL